MTVDYETPDPTPDHLNQKTQNGILAPQQPAVPPFSLLPKSTGSKDIILIVSRLCGTTEDDVEDVYPCTIVQEALVALSVKNPRTYVARYVYRLKDGITFNRFHAAWDATVRAHPILRTRVLQLGSQGAMQVVLRQGIECQRSSDLQQYLVDDCAKETPLGAPLVRAGFIQREEPTSPAYFVITLHHALYDDWSLALILKHIEAAYAEQRAPDQFFSRFSSYCMDASNETAAQFWRNELSRMNPTSFPALPAESYTPAATKSLIQTTEFDEFMTFDGLSTTVTMAWAILICRHTASEEVVFGVTDTGRRATMPGVELMSGPTIATFPFQVLVVDSQPVSDCWNQLHARRAEMVPHEQFGLSQMRMLSPEAAAACKFQSLIVLQPKRRDDYSLFAEVTHDQNLENHATFGTYPITLVVEPAGNSVSVQAVYDHNIVHDAQMKWLLQQHSHIMKWVNRRDNARVGDIEGLCPEDQAQLQMWNSQRAPENIQRCVHDLISGLSRSQPDATAVCSWDGELSYGELEVLSNGFAAQLLEEGTIKPDMIIPLYFEKCKWTPVAILGVIKAGAAFALLDPGTPLARLQTICESTRASFVVCLPELVSRARELTGKVSVLNTDDNSLATLAPSYTGSDVTPSNILYVVYTSGSTGQPKGVVIEHGAFCSSALAYIKTAEMNKETRALQFASYSFDVSVTDHLATLLAGGTICIPSAEDRMNDIVSVINKFHINYADFTPSFLRSLRPEDMPTLQTIVVGGEALSRAVIDIWGNHVRLLNIYGPAECCVLTTIQPHITLDSDPLNIGFGTGAVCWVADSNDHNRLVPIGAVGELLVGGPIVGRGYLNDPQKTEAVFIENPEFLREFSPSSPQNRVYRTGDLVQYAPDGSIRFLGRKDMQVKLRGQRIELGEIEYCLNQCFDIPGLVVDVVKFNSNTAVLVAFILRESVGTTDPNELFHIPDDVFRCSVAQAEAHLRTQLPGYMVPSLFVQLAQMPTTASGKIDRKRLKEYTASLSLDDLKKYTAAKHDKKPPSTEHEKVIHGFVARLLGLKPEAVGVEDTLFTLGGDSITAMRLAGLAMEQGWVMTVADIFASPKLCDMALKMQRSQQTDKQYQPLSLIQNLGLGNSDGIKQEAIGQCRVSGDDIEDIYPCTALQEGMMFLSLAKPGTYICHFLYTIPPEMTDEQLQQAWRQTTEANTILRTRFFQAGSRLYQAVIRDDHVTWDKPDDMEEYIAEDIQRQVDMGEQLVRVAATTTSDQTRVWVLTLHHSLCDGWTVRQLLEQTTAAYRGQTLHERPFSSFIEYVLDRRNDETQQYWQTEFANLDPRAASFPPLPSAHYAPQAEESLTYPILNLTDKGTEHTLTPLIRLAMAIALSRYSGSTDVVVGLTTSGRSASLPGINTVTGPTLGTYPMRIQLRSSETVEDVMSVIQANSIRVLPFEHFGLQNIRKVSPDAARACQFQTYLNVWPTVESEAPEPFTLYQDGYSGHAAFGGFALAMSCMLEPRNDGFTVLANYDPQTITHDQLTTFFSEFEQVVRQVWSDPSLTIGQIQVGNSQTGLKEPLVVGSGLPRDCISVGDASAEVENSGDIRQASVNETANIVCEAVANVLNVNIDSLKMRDNFFRIGGDSIAAMQVSAKCRSQGLLLTVADIFQKKFIAKIAEKAILAQGKDGILHNEGKIDTSAAWDALVSGKLPALGVVNAEEIEEIVPCTPLQQVMWLTGSRENGYYQPHTVWELIAEDTSRSVDTARLREAWMSFVMRHSTYRSLLMTVQQCAYQVMLKKPFSDNISTVRCTAADLQTAIAKQKDTPLSSLHVPYRLTIFETDADRVFLMMEQHHALDDAVSSSIFVDEWSQIYGGNTPDSTPVPFSKYIASLHSSSRVSDKTFWTEYLKDISPCLLYSHDSPIHRGNLHSTSIQLDHMQKITQFCTAHDITIAIFFKSLWAALLQRLTNLTDISFGYLVSTRSAPGIEATGSTGFYLNMLIQRLNIDETTKMTKVLDIIQEDYGQALTHQSQGLETLNARIPSRVFSTLVNHRRHAIDTKETRSLRFEPVEWSDGMDFDIVFEIDESEDNLQSTLTYWDGRVQEEMVSKASKMFTGLLSAVMEDPEQVLGDLL
ncbi:hypothetical protein ABOM_011048 [Aspergillus bombycis]|uniref:Carrier domain-containing protein n=1 Tax=Aspergillus bombycis TaxID=109264 RepID=A0A1F7ZMP8_9EURO|nr:hypothetical protein ABOM_011048 [Aspergillus bombycis]OGM40736.1 hypothetical protein ABOM_011048 [Aspergillus bombycis]